jgi:predicted transcriptional regulator
MLYNNYSCKWSDFKQDPLSINQSSLSSNLNTLIDNGFVSRENKEYIITPLGKTEYISILKLYDLDRQSILNEESKRIEEITKKTISFFEKYKIEDGDIKFRFLNNVLKLPFANLKGSLDSETDFNKVLLFLSMNHPNQYPFYISQRKILFFFVISSILLLSSFKIDWRSKSYSFSILEYSDFPFCVIRYSLFSFLIISLFKRSFKFLDKLDWLILSGSSIKSDHLQNVLL